MSEIVVKSCCEYFYSCVIFKPVQQKQIFIYQFYLEAVHENVNSTTTDFSFAQCAEMRFCVEFSSKA